MAQIADGKFYGPTESENALSG